MRLKDNSEIEGQLSNFEHGGKQNKAVEIYGNLCLDGNSDCLGTLRLTSEFDVTNSCPRIAHQHHSLVHTLVLWGCGPSCQAVSNE